MSGPERGRHPASSAPAVRAPDAAAGAGAAAAAGADTESADPTVPIRVRALREHLDQVDDAIVDLVASRLRLVRDLLAVKRALGAPLHDPAREAAILARLAPRARAGGIEPAALERLYRAIFDESHRLLSAMDVAPPGPGGASGPGDPAGPADPAGPGAPRP